MSPAFFEPSVVSFAVVGMRSTASQSSPSPEIVSDTPSIAIEPFRTDCDARTRPHLTLSWKSRPFGAFAAIVPRQSTCPWTICPPNASPARSARSKFTFAPGTSSPSPVRDSVSRRTSAVNREPSHFTTVRHTPLTATDSPSPSGFAHGSSAAISRTSPTPRETRLTVPTRWTSPVNITSSPRTARPTPCTEGSGWTRLPRPSGVRRRRAPAWRNRAKARLLRRGQE